ncbi:MAG: LysM peptidoglycan-binding domain-containing protein [Armatimonadetes bacterium]|nr:LysM peptidoglycan-binding domain-containing protein [Armatimonadota bacterium]
MTRRLNVAACFLVVALLTTCIPVFAATHTIKKGDTLSSIAAKNKTTVSKLAKANGLKETSILNIGKTITIPGTATAKKQPNRATTVTRQTTTAVHTHSSSACLREGPSTNARKVAVLPIGTSLKLISRNGKWAKVALPNGVCGFVYRPLLSVGASPSPKQTAKAAPAESAACADSTLIQTALACRGTVYRRGGTSRGGFDCSGFTRYVYAKYGVALPHSSAAQASKGAAVSKSDLQPGDLVFFQTSSRGISHVGIYIGNGNFVHAASRGRGVTVDSINSSYYGPRYRGARRVG